MTKNTIENKIDIICKMQNQLNNYTNGEEWRTGITNKGRLIDWGRCIRMESSEFIGSFNWKHWKDIDMANNLQNARMELVDILHFLVSEGLVHFSNYKLAKVMYTNYKGSLESTKEYSINEIMILMESLAFHTNDIVANFNTVWLYFFEICKQVELKFEDLYEIYLGKNALNVFRQNNGYKEGLYIKNWQVGENEGEDNVYLMIVIKEIKEESSDLTLENVLYKLQNIYDSKIN